ncbi:hypothetical protein J3Q64DRAFT_1713588 [Phycomyces blakesleeanus]|uniref:MARVEL domain-containing protein n=1 Tax=Phycomyces blakesleeanus TaxID=4837 RepID=A0ABR3BH46_PHYBL
MHKPIRAIASLGLIFLIACCSLVVVALNAVVVKVRPPPDPGVLPPLLILGVCTLVISLLFLSFHLYWVSKRDIGPRPLLLCQFFAGCSLTALWIWATLKVYSNLDSTCPASTSLSVCDLIHIMLYIACAVCALWIVLTFISIIMVIFPARTKTSQKPSQIPITKSIDQSTNKSKPLTIHTIPTYQPRVVPVVQVTAPSVDQISIESPSLQSHISTESRSLPMDTVDENIQSDLLESFACEPIILDLPTIQVGMSQLNLSFSSFFDSSV